MLEARNIAYAVKERTIVDGVSITITPGSVIGLVGPNGAGKTSLIRILGGHLQASGGEVLLDGEPLANKNRRDIARRLAMIFQEGAPISGFTVSDVVSMGRFPHINAWRGPTLADKAAVDNALEAAGVRHLEKRHHQTLSGGEKQLVQLARALAQEPRVLLMDEPAANLDLKHQVGLGRRLRILAEKGMAILISSHDLTNVKRWCDRAALLSRGRMIAMGSPSEVLSRALIREAFDVDVEA